MTGQRQAGWTRRLCYGDNLPVVRGMADECVDLIYLDPPFNSNRAYHIIYPDDLGQVTAFEDSWHWMPQCEQYLEELRTGDAPSVRACSILEALIAALGKVQVCAYLVNMGIRLVELRRILKPTGSIYLHCDPTASHYLKIVMDCIFEQKHFVNEIIWSYKTGGTSKKWFGKKHDVILFYRKSEACTFNPQKEKSYLSHKYGFSNIDIHKDEGGHYTLAGMRDVWDIPALRGNQPEKLDYPTQKPVALLERIIKASSNEGELVLDPFCGCGTSIASAEQHKRQWIGIDITYSAIAAVKTRFQRQKLDIWGDIEIIGSPQTMEEVDDKFLHENSPLYARKEFEKFCVSIAGGLPNNKMGAGGGIDGIIQLRGGRQAIISVKSGHVSVKDVRELKGILDKKRAIGIFITRNNPTKDMTEFANQSGLYEATENGLDMNRGKKIPLLQILTLQDMLAGKRPQLPQ